MGFPSPETTPHHESKPPTRGKQSSPGPNHSEFPFGEAMFTGVFFSGALSLRFLEETHRV